MTGDLNGKSPPPVVLGQRKSYNIADILKDKERREGWSEKSSSLSPRSQSPSDQNNNYHHHHAPTSRINPYPHQPFFNPSRLLPLLTNKPSSSSSSSPQQNYFNNSRNGNDEQSLVMVQQSVEQQQSHHHQQYFLKQQSPLVTSSGIPSSHPPTDFSSTSTNGQGTGYSLLGLGSLSQPTTLFQSPNYISLLLANPFVQPYLQHQQRFHSDFYGYTGRPFGMGSKRKGGQVRFAAAQTARLEKEFLDHKYLHANDRKRLAQALKLTDRQVKTWFQNRRAKWRKIGVLKAHRSESHVSASFGVSNDERDSPDQGRCVSVSTIASEDSSN